MKRTLQLDVHHWSTGDVVSYSVDVLWESGVPNLNKPPSLMVSTQDNGFQHMKAREVSAVDPLANRSGVSARLRLETNAATRHQE